jgi:hypothetical protein
MATTFSGATCGPIWPNTWAWKQHQSRSSRSLHRNMAAYSRSSASLSGRKTSVQCGIRSATKPVCPRRRRLGMQEPGNTRIGFSNALGARLSASPKPESMGTRVTGTLTSPSLGRLITLGKPSRFRISCSDSTQSLRIGFATCTKKPSFCGLSFGHLSQSQ